MLKSDIARTAAALLLTIVASATCVIGAVGPAQTAVPAPAALVA